MGEGSKIEVDIAVEVEVEAEAEVEVVGGKKDDVTKRQERYKKPSVVARRGLKELTSIRPRSPN